MNSAKTAIAVAFAVSLVAACQKSETTTTSSSATTGSVTSTTSGSTATAPTVSETATAVTVTDSSSTVTSTAPPASTTTPAMPATTSGKAGKPSKTKETTPSASPAGTETAATTATVPPPASAPSPRQETRPAEVPQRTDTPAPPGPTAGSAEGAAIFKRSGCTVCHGADATGNTPMGKKNNIPDFHSAAVQSLSDAELSRLIAEGKGPVSAGAHKSKHLTPDQVKALVAYIRTLKVPL